MNLIRFLFRSSKWGFVLAALASLFGGAAGVALIAVIHSALKGHAEPTRWVGYLGLLALAIGGKLVSQLLLAGLTQSAVLQLRLHLARRVLATPLRQLEHLGPAQLLATLTDDVLSVSSLVWQLPDAAVNVFIAIGALMYLGMLSPWLLLLVLIGLLLAAASYASISRWARPSLRQARVEYDGMLHHLHGLTKGIKELQLRRSRREAFVTHGLEASSRAYLRYIVHGTRIFSILFQWANLFTFALIGALIFLPPLRSHLSLEAVTGGVLTILFLVGPVTGLIGLVPAWTRANISLQKIHSLRLADDAAPSSGLALPAGDTAPPPFTRLRFEGVTHTYRGDRDDQTFLLGPIDFTVARGELVFIVGGNGSGKTTLAKLLVGLYTPESGSIHLDDRLLETQDLEWYRQHFTAVFAEPHLFERILGKEGYDIDDRARDYLAQLHLDRKVHVKDGTYSTLALSQGQRKRLALVTAYLEDRPVYLFDEWAADQDPAFKEIFYCQLLPELKAKGKAIIAITHDDRYFHLADRVVKLENGRVSST